MSKRTSNRKPRRPQDQNARALSKRSYPPVSANQQEIANRRGFQGSRPDGRPRGAERP